jgi:predicted ATPase/transcriptional regulator with XRE-family HTH domain
MDEDMSFGLWLRRRRKALDLTQQELAACAGCSDALIRKIEADLRRPSKQVAARLATYLHLTASEVKLFIQAARSEVSSNQLPPPTGPGLLAAYSPGGEVAWNTLTERLRPPDNLPTPLLPLIGRQRELAQLCAMLSRADVRLLTLSGPGGIGKTRLALQAVMEWRDRQLVTLRSQHKSKVGECLNYDGIWFVNLAPISDPSLVATTIAQALGVVETAGKPIEENLRALVHAKRGLLLLDNFEHLLDAAPLLTTLLAAAPRLKAFVTSRTALRLYGEHEFSVPPLAVPATHFRITNAPSVSFELGQSSSTAKQESPSVPPSASDLMQYDAVKLFVARAKMAKIDFLLTDSNALAVAEICRQVDGLPLAIELAAARIKLFSPKALLARLEQRLYELVGGPRDHPQRQQTLRATIDWSYRLLTADEQRLFRWLGVFRGGCTPGAVEAICVDWPQPAVQDRLFALVEQNLLRHDEVVDGEPRFVMLETLRAYALEQLAASGEQVGVQRRHAEYMLAVAEHAEPALKGSEQTVWLDRLERELENIRAALEWGLAHGEVETSARLAAALVRFWNVRAHHSEGRRRLEAVLARSEQVTPAVRAKMLYALGCLVSIEATLESCRRAEPYLAESVASYRALGDWQGLANALFELGALTNSLVNYAQSKDYARAVAYLEESLSLFQALGDRSGSAWALMFLGVVADDRHEQARAHARFSESLELMREAGDQWGMAWALMFLGGVVEMEGDYATAQILQEERLAAERALGNAYGVKATLISLGRLAFGQGDATRARRYIEEALDGMRAIGDLDEVVRMLDILGELALAERNDALALVRFGEMLALCRDAEDGAGVAKAALKLGCVRWSEGDDRRAAICFKESLDYYQRLVDNTGGAYAHYWLGCLALRQGEQTQAAAQLTESLAWFEQSTHGEGRVICLAAFAAIAAAAGRQEQAARLCGAAEHALMGEAGTIWSIYRSALPWSIYRVEYERTVAALHAQLDDATVAAAWVAGRAMPIEQAIAEALGR